MEAQCQAQPALNQAPQDFAEVYQVYQRDIFYLTLRLLGDSHKAEDATHDVFLKAYRKWGEFRGEASARSWLYRIAINHCTNLRRSWHSRNIVTNVDESVWETAPAQSESPLRVLEIKELGTRIQGVLDQMPEEYRLLVLLVANEALSYEEIGQLTEQSAQAVRGKLHRARKMFHLLFNKAS